MYINLLFIQLSIDAWVSKSLTGIVLFYLATFQLLPLIFISQSDEDHRCGENIANRTT